MIAKKKASSGSDSSKSSGSDDKDKKKILLGCTGSVASMKIPNLVERFTEDKNVKIKVVATTHALHFFNPDDISDDIELILDEDEWAFWEKKGDPVLHVDLSKWADVYVIAPIDANTLGKMANGLCDNLVTCIARAWNMEKPLIFCPAMNTKMFEHPITAVQIATLVKWGYIQIPPISKKLVCGDKGMGAMAEIGTIVDVVKEHFKKK